MTKELIFSSIVSAAWLAICFLLFGVLYIGIGFLIDPTGLMQFEDAWGMVRYGDNISISRVSLYFFGVSMFFAGIPINYYWLKRLNRERRDQLSE